jgi:hypothetical protein
MLELAAERDVWWRSAMVPRRGAVRTVKRVGCVTVAVFALM